MKNFFSDSKLFFNGEIFFPMKQKWWNNTRLLDRTIEACLQQVIVPQYHQIQKPMEDKIELFQFHQKKVPQLKWAHEWKALADIGFFCPWCCCYLVFTVFSPKCDFARIQSMVPINVGWFSPLHNFSFFSLKLLMRKTSLLRKKIASLSKSTMLMIIIIIFYAGPAAHWLPEDGQSLKNWQSRDGLRG